jgi:hypothetical protein
MGKLRMRGVELTSQCIRRKSRRSVRDKEPKTGAWIVNQLNLRPGWITGVEKLATTG